MEKVFIMENNQGLSNIFLCVRKGLNLNKSLQEILCQGILPLWDYIDLPSKTRQDWFVF